MTLINNNQLTQFLSSPDRPEGTLNYHQLQGFLFAICCSPELVLPSEWIPLVFNEHEGQYDSKEQAESIMQALLVLYNDINTQVVEGRVMLPDDITVAEKAIDNVGRDSQLGQWSSGFFMGHDWLKELWDGYTPEALSEDLGSSMMILGMFSDRKLAKAFYQEIAVASSDSFEDYVARMLDMFEDAMKQYAHLGRCIQTALSEQASEPVIRKAKTGRNEPCPCGSGKKYKKCCLPGQYTH